jgi:hypothetical protein
LLTTTLIMLLAAASVGARPGRAAAPGSSPAGSIEDHGVFVVSVSGQPVGTETFDIRSRNDRVEAEGKIELRIEHDGKVEEFKSFPKLVLDAALQPFTYSWSQKGPQSSQLEVDFRSSPAKVHYRTMAGEDDHRDFELPKDVVILDINVVHHYQLAAYRYHRTAGGKQTFQVFVPQEAMPGPLEVEETGQESVEIGGRPQTLRHLVLSAELARIDLWVDDQQRLQRMAIPAAQLEAVRKK